MVLKTIKSEFNSFIKQQKKKDNVDGTIKDYRTDLLNSNTLQQISDEIKSRVINRTISGFDYKNKSFVPYSPLYAKRKGVSINDVNLRLSGQMLNDFYVEAKIKPEYIDTDIFFIDLGALSIHYGFNTELSTNKYFWNADNQYGKNRDFLGATIGVPLLPSKELLEIIEGIVGTTTTSNKTQAKKPVSDITFTKSNYTFYAKEGNVNIGTLEYSSGIGRSIIEILNNVFYVRGITEELTFYIRTLQAKDEDTAILLLEYALSQNSRVNIFLRNDILLQSISQSNLDSIYTRYDLIHSTKNAETSNIYYRLTDRSKELIDTANLRIELTDTSYTIRYESYYAELIVSETGEVASIIDAGLLRRSSGGAYEDIFEAVSIHSGIRSIRELIYIDLLQTNIKYSRYGFGAKLLQDYINNFSSYIIVLQALTLRAFERTQNNLESFYRGFGFIRVEEFTDFSLMYRLPN